MPKQAAARMQRKMEMIMTQWEDRARKEVTIAGKQESLILRNSLPDLLRLITDSLQSANDIDQARQNARRMEGVRIALEHGSGRAKILGYTLGQLTVEYHILRQVIFDVLEQEGAVSPEAREAIVSLIEQAVSEAAEQFAEALQKSQEQLSNMIAHDLRSPITAAKASAQLILRHPNQEQNCIKMANRISVDMDRLDSMIRDLLDAGRIKAGQSVPLNVSECDLDSIASHVADDLNLTYGSRISVRSSGSCNGQWDANGLRRIIENLVVNAIKYGAPDKEITVRIDQSDQEVTLRVHNEGNPISASAQATLFGQFWRAASLRKQSGWGLGLSLVKGIAEAHHGSVAIESDERQGTTFTVRLPRNPFTISAAS